MRGKISAVFFVACSACGAFVAADGTGFGPTTGTSGSDEAVCDKLPTWSPQAEQYEADVLALVNQIRRRGGRCGDRAFSPTSPLETTPALTCVARAYAKMMHDGSFLSHTGKDQSTLAQRVEAGGLSWKRLAENIAQGQQTPAEVMNAWMTSEGHCSNIFGDYKKLGVGFFAGYWVQDFISP